MTLFGRLASRRSFAESIGSSTGIGSREPAHAGGTAMNGSRARVAVVVPTHDRDVELERAIRSIGAQTHPPACVLVVVDDAGSSGAKAAAERAALELPVRYVNAQDSPVTRAGASRNLGARHADPTDFIAFLDDDDYWSPFFLERMLRRIDETGADLVGSWAAMSDGHSTRAHAWQAAEGLSADDVVAANPGVTGSNFVVRRAVFDAIGGFDDGQWVFNDLDFFLRFLQWGRHLRSRGRGPGHPDRESRRTSVIPQRSEGGRN